MRILVGEDDASIADVVKIILEAEGYEVLHASTEKSLYKELSKQPDLILLDISLGNADGGKLTKVLKNSEETQEIPVIIVSANAQTEEIAQESGATGFLLKPFDMEQLLNTVKAYTRK